ncbi:GDSL esterase/lipase [Spatholobus suberectus]|nr:GDSL esterase/lipase [Spatholobus suberectus]
MEVVVDLCCTFLMYFYLVRVWTYPAEELKLQYLSAFFNSVGSNYRHGAHFAVEGSSIRPGGYNQFHLGLQVAQFLHFQSHTNILFNQLSDNEIPCKSSLPRPENFSNALYTFDIGQNDLAFGLQHTSVEQVIKSILDILSQFFQAVQLLYNEGSRVFWIHNTGPTGCLPFSYIYNVHNEDNLDADGCVKPQNELEFNRQLKDFCQSVGVLLRQLLWLPHNTLQGESHSKWNGIWRRSMQNPSQHVSWDGIHYSQAANEWVAKRILSGSLSDPSPKKGNLDANGYVKPQNEIAQEFNMQLKDQMLQLRFCQSIGVLLWHLPHNLWGESHSKWNG